MQVEDFNQFADAFVQRLDERVCFDLATALCPLCTMRSSMLSIARKLLNTPIVWWMKDATRVAQEGYEKIKCALLSQRTKQVAGLSRAVPGRYSNTPEPCNVLTNSKMLLQL